MTFRDVVAVVVLGCRYGTGSIQDKLKEKS